MKDGRSINMDTMPIDEVAGMVLDLVERVRSAARQLATLPSALKNDALMRMAAALEQAR